jgi:hypothetical protein
MKSKIIKFFGITLSLIYLPSGEGFFVTKPYGALHVHMGKVGFWVRKEV